MKENFYQKTWFIIFVLITMTPIGIVLLWRFGKFNYYTKLILSFVFLFLYIAIKNFL